MAVPAPRRHYAADLLEALVVLTTLDEELPTLQRALGGDQELVHVDRLHDEVVGAELQAGDRRLHVGGADQHDHGDVVVDRPHLLEELDTRDARHREVGHHEWRTARLERLHALAAVVREQTVVAGRDEDLVKDFACLMVVLDDQDLALRHVSPPPPTGRSWRGAYPPKGRLWKGRRTVRKAPDSGKGLPAPPPPEAGPGAPLPRTTSPPSSWPP